MQDQYNHFKLSSYESLSLLVKRDSRRANSSHFRVATYIHAIISFSIVSYLAIFLS